MIGPTMQELLNRLIQVEFNSAYLYLAASNYFNHGNLTGMAHWLRLQHDEEREHALKLTDYLIDLGGRAEVRTIPRQPVHFGTPLQAWQAILHHEQEVTRAYKEAYALAFRAGDYQTAAFLDEFLKEQVDEEAHAMRIVGRLEINRGEPAGLLLLDEELRRTAG